MHNGGMIRRQLLLSSTALAAALLSPFAAPLALAQDNTGQTIKLVVPYAAGGPIDVTARALAERVRAAAAGTDNLLYPMRDALRARATVGEVSDALRDVWGVYTPTDAF